jgi:crotonobetainyl-CoA:carnitine CoA-transferase CaiB-like acyl-CoA transferase
VAIAVRDDAEWQRCATVIGRPELGSEARFATLAARKAHEDELEALMAEWTLSQRAETVAERLQAAGIPAAVSMHSQDIAEDPHLAASGFFVNLPHREVGTRLHLGIPWRMSGTPCAVRRPAPCLGEHTDDVLRRVVGYGPERIAELRERGVLV